MTSLSCDPGSAEPMQGLHPYLLEFVREKLLNNEIPTPHNKQKAIDTLMERLQDYIDKIAVSLILINAYLLLVLLGASESSSWD